MTPQHSAAPCPHCVHFLTFDALYVSIFPPPCLCSNHGSVWISGCCRPGDSTGACGEYNRPAEQPLFYFCMLPLSELLTMLMKQESWEGEFVKVEEKVCFCAMQYRSCFRYLLISIMSVLCGKSWEELQPCQELNPKTNLKAQLGKFKRTVNNNFEKSADCLFLNFYFNM